MGRLKLKLRSHRWLRLSADTPRKSKIEVAEVHEKSNEEPATVADKFCLSPLNNKSFDIAYPSKNQQQVKSSATREAEVVSDVGCRCRRSSSNSHRLRTEEEEKPVRVNKSRAWKNENSKGEATADHGNNNSVPSSGSSLMNSRLSGTAGNSPLQKPISNGIKSSGSAAGFEPRTYGTLDNKNYNTDSAASSRENAENETENDLVNCNWWARKCDECACSHDVEGNLEILQGRCCSIHGKACQSFAEEKRSEDPYSDFRSSMVQMILEKNIYQPSELRGLLECFLSLNSPEHHGIIVEAFTEVCVNISSIMSEGT